MAGFRTHMLVSTAAGAAYGAWGYASGLPPQTCLLAGGLCSVSGMLPDLDSDSGRPVQEMSAFAAAVVPLLMLERFDTLGWTRETAVLVGAGMYLAVRFGVAELFKRYTVHRGMWHSLPACVACGLVAFLIVSGQDLVVRAFKSAAVSLGFFTHLVLDELWSFQLRSGHLHVKRSLGTALKCFSRDRRANLAVYATTALLTLLAVGDPMLMQHLGYEVRFGSHTAQQVLDKALELAGVQPHPQPDSGPTLQR
jgi:hypothetical protein